MTWALSSIRIMAASRFVIFKEKTILQIIIQINILFLTIKLLIV